MQKPLTHLATLRPTLRNKTHLSRWLDVTCSEGWLVRFGLRPCSHRGGPFIFLSGAFSTTVAGIVGSVGGAKPLLDAWVLYTRLKVSGQFRGLGI